MTDTARSTPPPTTDRDYHLWAASEALRASRAADEALAVCLDAADTFARAAKAATEAAARLRAAVALLKRHSHAHDVAVAGYVDEAAHG